MDEDRYKVEDQAARDMRITEARLLGFEVVFGDETHLLLDIDQPELPMVFHSLMAMAYDRFGAHIEAQWKSKSGNTHVAISLAFPMSMVERIALQAMLGSDPRKEMMSLCSHHIGVDNPVLLFKPPPKLLTYGSGGTHEA